VLAKRRAAIRRGVQLIGETFAGDRSTPRGRLRGFSHREAVRHYARPVVSGPVSRVRVSETAGLANVLINTIGGCVEIGDYVFFGHDVMLLTGTHDFTVTGRQRQHPRQTLDRSIVIEEGAWIASRSVIIGPCRIGANAVIGCGCVIDFDVPADTVVRVRQDVVMEPIRYRGSVRSDQRTDS
jgi:acetyltransferase-like isoleucine patch superfamily enzyme